MGANRFKSPNMGKENSHSKSDSVGGVASEVNILSSIKQIANKTNISTGLPSGQKLKIKSSGLSRGATNTGTGS
jgi:hypothetical protein